MSKAYLELREKVWYSGNEKQSPVAIEIQSKTEGNTVFITFVISIIIAILITIDKLAVGT